MGQLAISAFGTKLRYQPENTSSYVDLVEIVSISGPEETLDVEDATSHDSPEGYETVVPTILRSGNVTLETNYVPGDPGHQALRTDMRNRRLVPFELVFPDATTATYSFSAYVVNISPEAPHNGILTRNVQLKPSGPIVHVSVDTQ